MFHCKDAMHAKKDRTEPGKSDLGARRNLAVNLTCCVERALRIGSPVLTFREMCRGQLREEFEKGSNIVAQKKHTGWERKRARLIQNKLIKREALALQAAAAKPKA